MLVSGHRSAFLALLDLTSLQRQTFSLPFESLNSISNVLMDTQTINLVFLSKRCTLARQKHFLNDSVALVALEPAKTKCARRMQSSIIYSSLCHK